MRSVGCCFLSSLPLQTGPRRRPDALASRAHFWLLIRRLLLREGTRFSQGLSTTRLSPISMTSNSNLSNMRRMVEQLKLEASVERIKVKKKKKSTQSMNREPLTLVFSEMNVKIVRFNYYVHVNKVLKCLFFICYSLA